MDHSWRPPPAIAGTTNTNINININICPICSISHFPFCPPLIQNPNFNHYPPNDYYHQPPPFHHHINNNYYPDSIYNRPPSLNISPLDAIPDHNINTYNNHNSYGYDTGGIKRMKLEPFDNNNNYNNNNSNRGPGGQLHGFPSDNERILKLIHDHGNAPSATPTVGANGLKRRRQGAEISGMGIGAFQRNEPYYWSENKAHYGHDSFGQPPPPLPVDMPRNHFYEPHASVTPPKLPSLFPVADASSGSALLQNRSAAPVYYGNNASRPLSPAEDFHTRQSSSEKHARDFQPYSLRRFSSEKQEIIDASRIFKQPHRASRPDHLVIILRGLPGSGKSYLAKMLRDIEVENGGEAPRIHSMDEYFMIEVEKAEDSELSKSSGSLRGKRQAMKTVIEYCYEPEMEEAYRASMLKSFKKTLDEGVYSFIIVDDRNLRVADFAQFWATAKRSGYEVYLVEASYKDPAGCAARNVHNCTLADIQKMAGQWEEAPPLYLKMDIKSLLHGDGLVESGIQEVDMDMEDDDAINASQESDVKKPHDETKDQVDDFRPHDELKDATVTTHQTEEVKDLSRSKWSNNFGAEEEDGNKKISGGALSGLVEAYSSSKEAKSVSWGDQGGNIGFSIGATRKTNARSLVIGPGPGYNLKSNPLSEEYYVKPSRNAVEPRTQSVFQERIRAERESFKAVFDKRRQRIGGFNIDEE